MFKIPKLKFNKKYILGFVVVFALIGGSALLYQIFTTKGANYSWLQTTWSGGASTTATASHNTDQTGWNYYYSKDDGVDVSTPTELTLSAQTASTTDTETADFDVAVEKTNTYVAEGTVYLKKPNGASCVSNNECTGGLCSTSCLSMPTIGESFGGGKVFYISGSTIWISQTSDLSTAQWGCSGTTISGADSTTNGAQNTIDILNGCSTANIAADKCRDSEVGGYTDWYLPAKDQLNTLYAQRATVGGFTTNAYWSSTELNSGLAWFQDFYSGFQNAISKDSNFYVRCIRSF